ncbi:Lipoprotein-releasing system ATP-binding protein LolD [Candidatus Xiphinematobacter sp. Idaho Grape]|nr:Lipoprotein-releasing system ATP-binding protein LolD [Candidatus Xiphinematobacter sp. Idaho Grape]
MPVSAVQVEAVKLCQSFRVGEECVEVLNGVDLQISCGETVFICGTSGVGKTTLLYALAGLERPESGQVLFEGVSLYEVSHVRLAKLRNSRMGFVFQSYFLLPELTVLENTLLPAMILSNRPTSRAQELLDQVGLGKRGHHLPAELSGGEQQRVAIARALINKPIIVFADEPTGNLDLRTGKTIIDLLLNLVHQEDLTLVVVTHDPHLTRRGDRWVRLKTG